MTGCSQIGHGVQIPETGERRIVEQDAVGWMDGIREGLYEQVDDGVELV